MKHTVVSPPKNSTVEIYTKKLYDTKLMYENYYNKVKHCKGRKRKRRGTVGEGKGGTS